MSSRSVKRTGSCCSSPPTADDARRRSVRQRGGGAQTHGGYVQRLPLASTLELQQELAGSDIMEQSVAAEFEFGRRDIPKAPPIDAGAINRQVEVEGVSSAHDPADNGAWRDRCEY